MGGSTLVVPMDASNTIDIRIWENPWRLRLSTYSLEMEKVPLSYKKKPFRYQLMWFLMLLSCVHQSAQRQFRYTNKFSELSHQQ